MIRLFVLLLLFSLLLNAKSAFDYYKEGESAFLKGDYQTSIKALNKSLELQNNQFALAMICNALAMNYMKLHQYKQAEPYLLKALEIKERVVSNNQDLIDSYYNMSFIYKQLCDFKNEIKYYKLGLEKEIKKYGNNSIKVIHSYSHLGGKYVEYGNYPKALKIFKKVLNMKKKIFSPNHSEIAQSYNNIAGVYGSLGNFKKSTDFYNKTLKIRLALYGKNHLQVADSYNNIGVNYADIGNNQKALEYYQKALDIYRELGTTNLKMALTLNNLGSAYSELGDYHTGLKYILEALKINKKLLGEETKEVAKNYHNLSSCYRNIGAYQKSLKYGKKAIELHKTIMGKNHYLVAEDYNSLALIYSSLGEYQNAIKYQLKSLKIAQKVLPSNSLKLALIYNNLSDTYMYLGDYKNARIYIEKSIDIKVKKLGKTHPDTLTSYHNLGSLYGYLGNYNKALEYEKKANNYNGIANIYGQQREFKEALEYFEKSLEQRKKRFGNNHLLTAQSYHNIGSIYINMQKFSEALSNTKKALKIRKKIVGEDSLIVALDYDTLSQIYIFLKDYSKAFKYIKKALANTRKALGENHPETVLLYNHLGLYYGVVVEHKKAYEYMKKAYDIDRVNRKYNFSILDKQEKYKYIQSNREFISFLLRATYRYNTMSLKQNILSTFGLENRDITQTTFNDWLNYKRSIFDITNGLNKLYNKTKNQEIKSKIDELFANQRRLARLYQNIPQESKELKEYNRTIEETKEKNSKLERFLGSKVLSLSLKDITYQDISTLLKPNELYIDFAKIEDSYYFFTLDNAENITFQKIDENQTKTINHYIERIKEYQKSSSLKITKSRYAKLYNLIIKKINIQNKTSLIISPDGELGLIPFEAFYDDKEQKYLIEKLKIRYIPSGKELVKLYRDNSKTDSSDIVVFSDVDFPPRPKDEKGSRGSIFNQLKKEEYPYLEYSKRESEKIKELFKDNVKEFLQNRATEENLLKVNRPKILHLSTHGEFINDGNISNPLRKVLILLSGADKSIKEQKGDGIVSGLELAGLNLEGTELVVLSACKTGVGEVEDSEGVAGMSKAFMKAGAKYIIMTLWSVDDNRSALLMERFYKGVKDGLSYSDALREAQLSMIKEKENNHPYFWSGFVGSGRD